MCEKYPFASLFLLFINWFDLLTGGLTRHQNLRCYQKTIFLVDVLKVTRYDWQKSHFCSPVVCAANGWVLPGCSEGGGQKFVPAIENDALASLHPGCIHHFVLTRLFNRVFVLCLHNNSITVNFASNQKCCSQYNCCGVCGSFLSSRQFRSWIHLFLAR